MLADGDRKPSETRHEDSLGVDELRREVRRLWDAEQYLVEALRDLPEVPNYRVLDLLSRSAAFPEDWNIGKAMQRQHGFDAIPPCVEYEMGAGLWSRIRAALNNGEPL